MNRLSEATPFAREASSIRHSDSFASVSTKQTYRLGKGRSTLTKADEAAILSQATSQAVIAARSILLSGGTHETALSTAKAAALSVLLPSDPDAARSGNKFLARRRAKQQAEIIASMSIISAENSLPQSPQSPQHSSRQSVNHLQEHGQQWDIGSMLMQAPQYVMGTPPQDVQMQPNRPPSALTTHTEQSLDHQRAPARVLPVDLGQAAKSTAGKSTYSDAAVSPGDQIATDKQTPRARSFSNYFRKKTSRAVEDPPSDSNAQIAGTLPAKLPKSRNLAEAIPEEDPIYTHTDPGKFGTSNARQQRSHSRSFSTNGESLDYTDATDDWNTVGSTTVGTTVVSPDRFFVDPFLATITSVFNCGPNPPNTRTMGRVDEMPREDDREEESGKREESPQAPERESAVEPPKKDVANTQRAQPTPNHQRQNSGASSADSSALLRELNLSSDDEECRIRRKQPAPIESMEHIVLRALSAAPSKSPGHATDRMSQLREARRDEIFSGLQPNPSSNTSMFMESPSAKSKGMKKSSRFRKWASLRRKTGGGGVHNIHPLDVTHENE